MAATTQPIARPGANATPDTTDATDGTCLTGRLVRKITRHEGNQVPPETREEIYYWYWVVGLSLVEVSKHVFWSEKTCGAVLVADGHGLRHFTSKCPFNTDQRKLIINMFEGGSSRQDIAEVVGCYPDTVIDWLHKWGYDVTARAKWRRFRARRIRATLEPDTVRIRQHIERCPGATPARIARQTGLSLPNVRNRIRTLRDAGIIRPVGDARGGQGRRYVRTRRSLDDPIMPPMPPPKISDTAASGQVKKEDRLPVEPLRAWVENLVVQERARLRSLPPNPLNPGAQEETSGMTRIAHRLITNAKDPERRLRALLYEQKNVSIDVADQILMNAPSWALTTVSDLWPDRFPDWRHP